MWDEQSECGPLGQHLATLGASLDAYLRFEGEDALTRPERWRQALQRPLPDRGVGLAEVLRELGEYLVPNGSQIPRPGCSSFITTGATTVGALATLAGAVAAPQRGGLHAFNFVEDLSLRWLTELFSLPATFQGIYSSGGSVANLLALGAARQRAFERIGVDVAREGVRGSTRVFASVESHHSVQRACSVLGLGRDALVKVPCDAQGRIRTDALVQCLDQADGLPVAIVGNLGSTNSGAIDPVSELVEIARARNLWLHLDGAYGLPGVLDPAVAALYDGMAEADSIIVDPHKWLGAPVGIGATFVRDIELLQRAFTQEPAAYLEGSLAAQTFVHSMDSMGTPYSDWGVELSAPSRGAVVWALLREIGREGMAGRIRRHNGMARRLAAQVMDDPHLELLREPTLSICCFRYVDAGTADLDGLNRAIHRELIHGSRNMPSTTQVNGKLAIRPCFVGARAGEAQVDELLADVQRIGRRLSRERT
ncbi:MAG: aminotransferase class V-fold PLP-dependent enzyme [Pseudomonadota bacterium]|nr:aminotransferase class V-fold PLP-dependent enzyme [Pseudomonadota bacterium]